MIISNYLHSQKNYTEYKLFKYEKYQNRSILVITVNYLKNHVLFIPFYIKYRFSF